MRKIVLEVQESAYDRLVCLALSKEKCFSKLVLDIFEADDKAKNLYNEMSQLEFQKLTNEVK